MTRRGNYSRDRREGTMTFLENTKKLAAHTIKYTNKKFSKSVRFTLSNRMIDKAFEIQHLLLLANEMLPNDKISAEYRISKQIEALVCCKEFAYYIEVARMSEQIKNDNEENYWSSILVSIQRSVGGWHKSDKQRYKHLL